MNRLLPMMAALVLGLLPATAATATPSPSHQVSPSGQYLYEFEALLKQAVGVDSAPGSSDYLLICGAIRPANLCHFGWFYKSLDVPNEDITVYQLTFANFDPSTLHLMPSWFAGAPAWGNRTEPVMINGRLISCNAAHTEFLVGNLQAFGARPSGAYEPTMPGGGIMVNGGGWNWAAP